MPKFRFNRSYFLLTLALFGIEIFIGACMHDAVIRPYGGDLLVVVLLYCFFQTFWNLPVAPLSLGVLLFAYLEETGQYYQLADRLGFSKPSIMRVVIGYHFSWVDMLSYTAGIGLVLLVEGLKQYICDHLLKRARSSAPSGDVETRSC